MKESQKLFTRHGCEVLVLCCENEILARRLIVFAGFLKSGLSFFHTETLLPAKIDRQFYFRCRHVVIRKSRCGVLPLERDIEIGPVFSASAVDGHGPALHHCLFGLKPWRSPFDHLKNRFQLERHRRLSNVGGPAERDLGIEQGTNTSFGNQLFLFEEFQLLSESRNFNLRFQHVRLYPFAYGVSCSSDLLEPIQEIAVLRGDLDGFRYEIPVEIGCL